MSQKSYILYKAVSLSNKVYIGITSQSLKNRINSHISLAKRAVKRRPFADALRKYDYNFSWEIIETNLTKELAEIKEIEMIKFYNSTDSNFGYNLSPGGLAGSIMSKSGKKIHKEKMRKHYDNPDYVKNITKHLINNYAEEKLQGVKDYFSKEENHIKHSEIIKKTWEDPELRKLKAKVMGGKPFKCNETNKIYYTLIDAAKDLGSEDKQVIYRVLKGIRKSYKKHTFSYIN